MSPSHKHDKINNISDCISTSTASSESLLCVALCSIAKILKQIQLNFCKYHGVVVIKQLIYLTTRPLDITFLPIETQMYHSNHKR